MACIYWNFKTRQTKYRKPLFVGVLPQEIGVGIATDVRETDRIGKGKYVTDGGIKCASCELRHPVWRVTDRPTHNSGRPMLLLGLEVFIMLYHKFLITPNYSLI